MADLIDRQAAVDAVQAIDSLATLADGDAVVRSSAVEYVLYHLPAAQPTQTNTPNALETLDCVSRQAVLTEISRWRGYLDDDMIMRISIGIKRLPSAQPERKKGRWQEITESDCSGYDPVLAGYDDPVVGYVCSTCHEGYEKEVMGKVTWKYCPNCGAQMMEGEG